MPKIIAIPSSASKEHEKFYTESIWAFSERIHQGTELTPGEKIFFSHLLKYNGAGRAPRGFPRLKSFDKVPIKIGFLYQCKVISSPKKAEPSPFGMSYPYLFQVKIEKINEEVEGEDLNKELIEAIRLLCVGRNVVEFE